MKIVVLMSTYNGGRFLREQIESVLAQDIAKVAEVQLIVRDDGSTDDTRDILNAYQTEKKLTWYAGENLKPAKSFWHLLLNAPNADFYSFCDQDDYWFPNKLSRAVEMILKDEGRTKPVLYCSAYIATDADLNPIDVAHRKVNQFTDYAHALLYSTAPGCTFVFNDPARRAMHRYDMDVQYEVIHDWLVHKIVTILGGTMILDESPSMYYRQHNSNAIGVQTTGRKEFIARVNRFFKGSGRGTRSENAKSLLAVYGNDVTSEVHTALDLVANYQNSIQKRVAFLTDMRFATGTVNDFFLKILILLGKI